ncbi:hypothetical protein [Pelomonas sp. SE-A7]|uniref:aldose epimerase family protein n=1 Tax=Pelomonas sp. SE-A7 TaxID=3054953 RepID=UPI00259CC237|nr:hypothetical protein [Pelomonas sp. SE-A7]MDM4765922.1 hypothetical protein [Pelomonas sp. SE-A7]
MLHELSLGSMSATVGVRGAELRSLRRAGEEFLQAAEPGRAILQFPNVGRLREDGIRHGGSFHALPQDGFAAHCDFRLVEHTPHSLVLALRADAHTRECYPFEFELRVAYALQARGLKVDYRVHNRGLERLAFGLGSQPVFTLPLAEGESLQDWSLAFDAAEAPEAYRQDGPLLSALPQPFAFSPPQSLQLGSPQFASGRLAFKHINSQRLDLVHARRGRRLSLLTGGAPHLGLWSRHDAVCIAPWYGIEDDAQAPLELLAKPSAIQLPAGRAFVAGYRIELA